MKGTLTSWKYLRLSPKFWTSEFFDKIKKKTIDKDIHRITKTEELKSLANKIGKPLSQLALNWLVKQDEVGPVICGAQTRDEIIENIESVKWEIADKTLEEIEEILDKYSL